MSYWDPCQGLIPRCFVLIVFSQGYCCGLEYSNVGSFHLILTSRSSIKVKSTLPDFTCLELVLSSFDIFSTPGISSSLMLSVCTSKLVEGAEYFVSLQLAPFCEISDFFGTERSANKSRMERCQGLTADEFDLIKQS